MAPSSNSAFRALADPTRREILQALRQGPLTSGEIASRFESSWPTISRHLAILREAGLVNAERSGQAIHYELNTSVFHELVQHLMSWSAPVRRAKTSRGRQRRKTPRFQES